MSTPKVGDRVRVVIEDYICGVDEDDGEIDLDAGSYLMGYGGVVSIEVIPAPFVLPTKRWAQVMDAAGWLWTRQGTAEDELDDSPCLPHWFNSNADLLGSSELVMRSGLRVISEGVDE